MILLILISCSSEKQEEASTLFSVTTAVVSTNTPTPIATQRPPGTVKIRPADEMVLVFVPGGTFSMGSDYNTPYTGEDEKPIHLVSLNDFWIDQTEVTNGQYALCVAAGACQESSFANESSLNGVDLPVVGVSWLDADSYCHWADSQLPTEAQWEYAARGPDGYKYPWGNNNPTCELAQYTMFSSCSGMTISVGILTNGASWVKAYDMAGNAVEWVQDWYDPDFYENSPTANPTGPSAGDYKVLRGGSWNDPGLGMQTTSRDWAPPNVSSNKIGFRCTGQSLK